MPLQESEIKAQCGSTKPETVTLLAKVGNAYLAKVGDTEQNRVLIRDYLVRNGPSFADFPLEAVADFFFNDLNKRFNLFRTPDRVLRLWLEGKAPQKAVKDLPTEFQQALL